MKEEIARRWVEELRSGRHTQGRDALIQSDGAKCCLGVLAFDVLGSEPRLNQDWLTEDERKLAGLGSINPETSYIGMRVALSYLNDDEHDFAQIADIIEANWEKL